MVAGASCLGAVVPVPGVSAALDLGLVVKKVNSYRCQLGLPEKESELFKELSPEMKARVHRFCTTGAMEIGKRLAAYAASSSVEEFARYVPVLGSVIAGSVSFSTTYYFLHTYLSELEETAMNLLDEIKAKAAGEY